MLEPHAPHETPHTWKDFFIHIAVIVVGLLIAVGLEQTVEAIHRHHERQRLMQELQSDSENILRDSATAEMFLDQMIVWVHGRERVLSDAEREQRPPAAEEPFPAGSLDLPDEPIYRNARASGKLDLLHDEDAGAYAEIDLAFVDLTQAAVQWNDATQQSRIVREATRYGNGPGDAPFAHARPEDLRAEYKAYLAQERGMQELRLWCRQVHDVTAAVAGGERDARKIRVAEHQRQNLP